MMALQRVWFSTFVPTWSKRLIEPFTYIFFSLFQGSFPDASRDPIIQIANMVKIEGQSEPFIRNCFVLGTCDTVVGSDIIECRDEAELLTKWSEFIRQVDPDLLTGYNIQNFDLPYILDRAKCLKVSKKKLRVHLFTIRKFCLTKIGLIILKRTFLTSTTH